MNYYNKNMEYIEKYKKYFYQKMQEFDKNKYTGSNFNIVSIATKDGNQALQLTKDGQIYRLNSLYNPTNEASKWADQYSFKNFHVVIEMFGFGNGVFARELMNRMGEEDRLLIYEPCTESFLHTLNQYDISDILSNKKVSIAVNNINSFEFHNLLMASVNQNNIRSQIFCSHPKYEGIFQYEYRDFLKELKNNNTETVVNTNTGIALGKRMIKDSLKNIKYLAKSNTVADFIGDFPTDVPAIIVAAGPSIKKNVAELKKAKGKAVIFAVDRILEFLLDNGVVPDFVVTLAPIKPSDMFSTRGMIDIPIITTMEANPEILDMADNKKIICDCNDYISKIYTKLGKTPPKLITGISVATQAYSVCRMLGLNTVVLVGQDLAYDEEGNSHASAIKEIYLEQNDILVEGINGNQVKSRLDWYRMMIWYQDMIECFPNVHIIDATEGGAKIKGTTIMKLSEVIEQYCKIDVNCKEIVKNKKSTFNIEELIEFQNNLRIGIDEMDDISEKVEEGISICEQLETVYATGTVDISTEDACIMKLSKINQFIENVMINKYIDLYITSYATEQLMDIYLFTEDEKSNMLKTISKAKLIYKTTQDGIKYIKPLLQESILDLSNSIEAIKAELQ